MYEIVPRTFPNPLMVLFGTGHLLLSVGHEPDGSAAVLGITDSGEPHPIGERVGNAAAAGLLKGSTGQILLHFANMASALSLQTTINELIEEWTKLNADLPIPGPGGDGRAHAPFTGEQVLALAQWQTADHVHALEHCGVEMTPHADGLHCPKCKFIQTWVPRVCLAGPPPAPRAELDPKINPAYVFAEYEADPATGFPKRRSLEDKATSAVIYNLTMTLNLALRKLAAPAETLSAQEDGDIEHIHDWLDQLPDPAK